MMNCVTKAKIVNIGAHNFYIVYSADRTHLYGRINFNLEAQTKDN